MEIPLCAMCSLLVNTSTTNTFLHHFKLVIEFAKVVHTGVNVNVFTGTGTITHRGN